MRWFRFVLCTLFGATIFVSSFSTPVCAEPNSYDPSAKNFYYHRDTSGYVEIILYTGTGTGAEFVVPSEIDGVPVRSVISLHQQSAEGRPERLIIPEGVFVIGGLFSGGNENLKEVILPSTLKVIGQGDTGSEGAFLYTTSLKELTIPPSVGLISQDSFHKDLLLRVEAGSYAHRWAKANEHPFEIIQHDPSIGDYDADGLTTSTDARLLLQYTAGKVAFDEVQAAVADVDGDGVVTTTDARLTLQYAAGKEAVKSLTCPLTFNIPFIPRNSVTGASGSVIVSCPYEEDDQTDNLMPGYNYSRAPGPLKSPLKMVDYLNKQIGQEYHAQRVLTIKGQTTGAGVTVRTTDFSFSIMYRLYFYGVSLSLSRDSQFYELVME